MPANQQNNLMLKDLLLVGIGGGIGSMLRYGVTIVTKMLCIPATFGTLFVNIIGSFLIGILLSICEKSSLNFLLIIGLCGGFTTFSTFSVQTIELLRNGNAATGMLYILGTVIMCLLLAWGGFFIGEKVIG